MILNLVFWQNKISPHQLPYIKVLPSLPNVYKVTLVVSEVLDNIRESMGWNNNLITAENSGISVIINPSIEGIKKIIENDIIHTHHYFSGIRAYPLIFSAFKISLNYSVKRYLIVEGPFTYRKPILLHILKSFVVDRKYFPHIEKVFAIGEQARNWYSIWNFTPSQIVPFTYCVTSPQITTSLPIGDPKILYVGSLIHRKGVDLLIEALDGLKEHYNLDIIGSGKEELKLKCLTDQFNLNSKIRFLGMMNNTQVRQKYMQYDALILPSRHDGWGAVVNEALMAGLYVIVSDKCGSKDLIINRFNGIVYSYNKIDNLTSVLNQTINNIENIRANRSNIIKWSNKISGENIARYLINKTISNENSTYHFLD